ncbi:MAG: hypothetical protein MPK06_01905 [Alphaproteobacteria bacterium]|nr:hypothetical protein [Alphaproteobacteria bacterium]MDA8005283.1 hypothetical protein [Alphaproteobacteria bacterium]MDA8012702.1 hypothetical protein [Alphaproteobacteria bacterium]
MQIDMHYYCTYFLARTAGLPPEIASSIANSSQFVDDNTGDGELEFSDGSTIHSVATAHHPSQVIANSDHDDQIRIWVPFHFYPGGEGGEGSEGSLTQMLICIKDGKLINEAIDDHLSLAGRSFSPYLMGVVAHVYADTFSHYGFSGVGSRRNLIAGDMTIVNEDRIKGSWNGSQEDDSGVDYITDKLKNFFNKTKERSVPNFFRLMPERGSLGHGSVATYPDRPYLHWRHNWGSDNPRTDAGRFKGENKTLDRNNPETFLEGTERLHEVFIRYRDELAKAGLDGWSNDNMPAPLEYGVLRGAIKEVLEDPGDKEYRSKCWENLAKSIFPAYGLEYDGDVAIPPYRGEEWNEAWARLKENENRCTRKDLKGLDVWQFHRAASVHRNYTLRQLLPEYNVVLS